jgi:xanthine/uracil permease
MKKVMWIGFSIQIIMIMVMLLLMIFKQQIPDLLFAIMVGGMLTCIISSFFVIRERNRAPLK